MIKPFTAILSILFIGLILFLYSVSLEYYTDPDYAQKLDEKYFSILRGEIADSNLTLEEIERKKLEMWTIKAQIMDLGIGLIVTAFSLLLFFKTAEIEHFTDLSNLKSKDKPQLIMLSLVSWIFVPIAFCIYTLIKINRGDYGLDADGHDSYIKSMMFIVLLLFVLWIPLAIFVLLTTINTRLPAPLFIKLKNYGFYQVIIELLFDSLILFNVLLYMFFVYDGNFFLIPINITYTYVLCCLRAGQLNRYRLA
ncbi:hypothetical protein [Chondrinema litorale]|uniref:hypothetical protein n=1 Tax=Chondrinema litorale TaxID=2994555 RepID=UPI00254338FF|nr:hypothetical protein [Chondrinema litorale]UZR93466.1 hypothetical protein OQ292_16555 [Chondrinema litorale]